MTNATDWTGPVGDVWASEWRRTDRSFAGLAPHLNAAILAAAAPGIGIVDIGCGAGATSIAVADALPDACVTGIDLSPALIAIAGERAAGRSNVAFTCADILATAPAYRPDLLISRHGVMFFADPVAAFATLASAAAPGARLVFSCFAERAANRWAAESLTAVGGDGDAPTGTDPGPFAFADPARVAAMLAQSGWAATHPQRIDFAYRAGVGDRPVDDAVDFFSRIGPSAPLLRAASPSERSTAIARLTAVCERYADGDAADFPASAWIWTAEMSPKGSLS